MVLQVRELDGGVHQPAHKQGQASVLILHANGYPCDAYRPLAGQLAGMGFRVLAMDQPGHGDAGLPPEWPFTRDTLVSIAAASLQAAGTPRPLCCLGHSGGAALGLLLEATHPGTFAAVYAYEPPLVQPWAPEGALPDGRRPHEILSEVARKRRPSFRSREEAAQHLGLKPPFSLLHPEAFSGYLAGALRPRSKARAGSTSASSAAAALSDRTAGQGHGETGSHQGLVLCPSPEVEAEYYRVYDGRGARPFQPHRVKCPARIATGNNRQGLNGPLTALGPALSAALPVGSLKVFSQLGHFGPLENPQLVAKDAAAFFRRALVEGNEQQQGQGDLLRSRL